MDCGEFAASSVNTSEAERCPSATGLKFTVILQLCCVATAAAMHVLVCEKSPGFEPLIATPETCNVLLPEFVTWTDLAATVAPSSTVPKSKFAGEIVFGHGMERRDGRPIQYGPKIQIRGRNCYARRCSHARSNRSEEHTSELQSRFGIWYAVFCLTKKNIVGPSRTRVARLPLVGGTGTDAGA